MSNLRYNLGPLQRVISFITRMHSSRMRTACLLPVSRSMHCSGGGGCVPAPGGMGVPARGVPGPGGVPGPRGCTCPGACTCLGGVPGSWGWVYLLGGVPAQGVDLPGGVPAQVLPPCEQNRCKSITLPQTSFAGSKNLHFVSDSGMAAKF